MRRQEEWILRMEEREDTRRKKKNENERQRRLFERQLTDQGVPGRQWLASLEGCLEGGVKYIGSWSLLRKWTHEHAKEA